MKSRKIQLLTSLVVITSASWLTLSFRNDNISPSAFTEARVTLPIFVSTSSGLVPPTHPNSHRLGIPWADVVESVPLPSPAPRDNGPNPAILEIAADHEGLSPRDRSLSLHL